MKTYTENPFEDDVAERLPEPTTLIIFGAKGDLAARKLLPAVYNLAVGGRLPEHFRLYGLGLGCDSKGFKNIVRQAIMDNSRTEIEDEAWSHLESKIEFIDGDFSAPETFTNLRQRLEQQDRTEGPTQRLFYLAVAPRFFAPIAKSLHTVGLGSGADPETKIIIEKPFGHDLPTALELNRVVNSAFDESQVYRIDHYLGKETVQNLLVWRFANGIFEPIWNRRYVDHVQITVAESLGVGHRGNYYDAAGALRDIVQNHMMQLVSLIAMEPPGSFSPELVRNEKVKLLQAIKWFKPENIVQNAVRGQYIGGWIDGEQVPDYRTEANIPADSNTETFVALRLQIDNWRWAGTPFYLRTGKCLPSRSTQITVCFRPVPHLPFKGAAGAGVTPNKLVFSIQPNEGASMQIMAKLPGSAMSVRPVQMDFQYGAAFLSESPEAYERLLHDALIGEATLFTRSDEVEAAWRLVDPVLNAWQESNQPPEFYPAGSEGPGGANELLAQDGRAWQAL